MLCVYSETDGFYECLYYSNGDPFYSQTADYKVSLTLSESLVVASAGELVKAKTENGVQTVEYKLENARSFSMVLSKEFECVTDTTTGVRINYYYYADANPKQSLEYAVKSMKYFNQTFGEYPYSTFSVVQTKFVQGGMEYPTLVMISDALEPNSYGEVIVHETAHQWWQTTVGNNQIEYGFLDEGLAEYSVVLFFENHPEYSMTRESLIKSAETTYKVFCSVYDKLFGSVDTTMLRSLGEYTSEYEYVNIAYIKTCIMYDYLRKTVGEDLFFKGLKRYYQDNKFGIATPSDLVGAFEKSGCSANGFFQSFFDGKEII
jgi:aminopeptidase N